MQSSKSVDQSPLLRSTGIFEKKKVRKEGIIKQGVSRPARDELDKKWRIEGGDRENLQKLVIGQSSSAGYLILPPQ